MRVPCLSCWFGLTWPGDRCCRHCRRKIARRLDLDMRPWWNLLMLILLACVVASADIDIPTCFPCDGKLAQVSYATGSEDLNDGI